MGKNDSRVAVCVLTAAGRGTRLGADCPKALVRVGEHTLLAWSLRGLAKSKVVGAVVITAPGTEVSRFQEEVARYEWPFQVVVVEGGLARQGSVARGLDRLQQLAPEAGIELTPETPTLVHDAARPFTPSSMIREIARVVRNGKSAVIPGRTVTDTIKIVEGKDPELAVVTATPSRSHLRSIQTPQAFHWELIRQAHEKHRDVADSEYAAASDDAALIEMDGGHVWVVPGDRHARKITTKSDLDWAENLRLPQNFL